MRNRYVLTVCTLAVLCLGVVVWYYGYRICHVQLEPIPGDNPDWVYFPVVARGDSLSIPMSYMRQIDLPLSYNAEAITPQDPVDLRVTWHFRRVISAGRYGFVFRIWPSKGKIDDSTARVYWLTRSEMERAIRDGRIRLPRIRDLPAFPQNDLASLARMSAGLKSRT